MICKYSRSGAKPSKRWSRDVVGVRGERRERSPPVYVKRRAVFRVVNEWSESLAHTYREEN
jgi:hypothetical protein